jgi:hypothetical protein
MELSGHFCPQENRPRQLLDSRLGGPQNPSGMNSELKSIWKDADVALYRGNLTEYSWKSYENYKKKKKFS